MGTDTAFLDRFHCYVPGWEIPKYRPDSFTNDYDYFNITDEMIGKEHSVEGKLNQAEVIKEVSNLVVRCTAGEGKTKVKIQHNVNETINTYWIKIL